MERLPSPLAGYKIHTSRCALIPPLFKGEGGNGHALRVRLVFDARREASSFGGARDGWGALPEKAPTRLAASQRATLPRCAREG